VHGQVCCGVCTVGCARWDVHGWVCTVWWGVVRCARPRVQSGVRGGVCAVRCAWSAVCGGVYVVGCAWLGVHDWVCEVGCAWLGVHGQVCMVRYA